MREQASLLVPMPGSAWQAHPGDKVEVRRIVHVGKIQQTGNLPLPKNTDWRGNLAEFILAGHAIERTDRRADPVLRLDPSRIQTADDSVGLTADQMREALLRIKNLIANSVVMGFHGISP